ncbi:PEP-CTERM sorting domain-containing protein [filamentous cyanobacterium CCP5]|nr:PEP-CTERM sorting domain-containing protein [filamentous cyanobacterium CCP5]
MIFPPRHLMLTASGLASLLGSVLATPVSAASFSQIYAFGDSLVDTGNAFALSQSELGIGIPPEPYFEGRFSNGLVFNEYLATDLGIPETSFGFGGASTGSLGALRFGGMTLLEVPGLLAQVDQFVATAPSVDPDALYVLWAGFNDYFFEGVTDPFVPVGNLTSAVNTLSGAGAKNFLIGNLPDLGEVPLAGILGLPPEVVAGLNLVSNAHNQILADTVAGLDASDSLSVDLLDANSLIRAAIAGEFGFSNVSDPCTLTPSCLSNPTAQSSFLFWDQVHPTTRAYRIVADTALAQISHNPVSTPEPTAVIGLSLVAAFAARRFQRSRA